MRVVRRWLVVGAVASLIGAMTMVSRGGAVRAAGVGIAYSVADTSVDEGSSAAPGTMTFTVTAEGVFTSAETVHYATENGTAKAGVDYTATSGDLTFTASGTKTVNVALVGDNVVEPDELFNLKLSNNAAISDDTGVGTITNDDFTLSVGDNTKTEGNSATSNATVQISLSAPRNAETTVHYQTSSGTAASDEDYTSTSGTATIPANQQSTPVNIPVIGDTLYEDDETFTVTLSAPSSPVTIDDGSAVVTIANDDAPPEDLPKLSIADASTNESDDGTHTAFFTVSLDGPTSHTVTVKASTANGTATAGEDYAARNNATLSFPPSAIAQTQSFGVTVHGDEVDEDDETFTVTLSSPTAATLDDTATTGTMTITDDDATPPTTTTTTTLLPSAGPDQITTGAGPGSGSHVRVFDSAGAPKAPDGFFPYANGPGVRVARGDLDGDGHDEIIVATGPGAPSVVKVFTPNGATLLAQVDAYPGFEGGVYIAAGDLDGDGRAEVVTSAGPGGGPHIRSFELIGDPGSRLLQGSSGFFGSRQDFHGGLTVAVGDVDGDHSSEIIAAAATADQPVVYVWRYNPTTGIAGQPSGPFLAYAASFTGGVTVAAGDLDGDGKAEIVTGPGPGGGPHVRVFTGLGGGLPGSAYAYDPGFSGGVFVAMGDVDGNGRNEIITAAGPGGGPHVRSFDLNMAPLPTSFYAYAPTSSGGVFVAAGRP